MFHEGLGRKFIVLLEFILGGVGVLGFVVVIMGIVMLIAWFGGDF